MTDTNTNADTDTDTDTSTSTDDSHSQSDAERAEALLQQSSSEKRHTTDPTDETTDTTDGPTPTLAEAIIDAYHDLDTGDRHQNLTVRDEHLAALIAGLEATDRLHDVGQRAHDALGRDDTDIDTRADVLKALLRVALHDVAPEELDTATDAKRDYLTRNGF